MKLWLEIRHRLFDSGRENSDGSRKSSQQDHRDHTWKESFRKEGTEKMGKRIDEPMFMGTWRIGHFFMNDALSMTPMMRGGKMRMGKDVATREIAVLVTASFPAFGDFPRSSPFSENTSTPSLPPWVSSRFFLSLGGEGS